MQGGQTHVVWGQTEGVLLGDRGHEVKLFEKSLNGSVTPTAEVLPVPLTDRSGPSAAGHKAG